METKEMTPEQSLQIISDAINRSRKDFERNSGTPMILWGTVVLAVSIAIWLVLRTTSNPVWNFLWFSVPVLGWAAGRLFIKDSRNKGAKNFINETIGQIWIGYGIFATTIALILAFIAPQQIGAIILALLGYGTFMTGRTLKNIYITIAGIITGIGGAAILYLLKTYDATLIFTATALISLIIPGIMMNHRTK